MRIVPVLVVVAACTGAPAPKFPTPVDGENQVVALENEWVQLEMSRNAEGLKAILDDHFAATFGGAEPMDKATFVQQILADTEGWKQALSEQKVIVDGDVAFTTGVDTVTPPDKPSHAVRYTAMYVYRDGHWRAFAQHMALIPPPPAPATPPADAPPPDGTQPTTPAAPTPPPAK